MHPPWFSFCSAPSSSLWKLLFTPHALSLTYSTCVKSCLVIFSGSPTELCCDFFIRCNNVYLFLFTDSDYLFVHGIAAASWIYNSLSRLVKGAVTVLWMLPQLILHFYNAHYTGICITAQSCLKDGDGRVQKGNDGISAEPEMMGGE